MADGDVKDYAGEKKKPSLALVISVGPKTVSYTHLTLPTIA